MCVCLGIICFPHFPTIFFPSGTSRGHLFGGDRGVPGGGDLERLGAGRLLLPGELHRERLHLRPPPLGCEEHDGKLVRKVGNTAMDMMIYLVT